MIGETEMYLSHEILKATRKETCRKLNAYAAFFVIQTQTRLLSAFFSLAQLLDWKFERNLLARTDKKEMT